MSLVMLPRISGGLRLPAATPRSAPPAIGAAPKASSAIPGMCPPSVHQRRRQGLNIISPSRRRQTGSDRCSSRGLCARLTCGLEDDSPPDLDGVVGEPFVIAAQQRQVHSGGDAVLPLPI